MKIAIPLYRDRVAPHFGTSSTVLLIELQEDAAVQESRCKVGGKSAMETARRLFEVGIGTLICGGIESYFKDWLTCKGVTVLDNQSGPAREVIRKFLESGPLSKRQDV